MRHPWFYSRDGRMDQNHTLSNWQTTLTGNCHCMWETTSSHSLFGIPRLFQGLRYLRIYLSICVRQQSVRHVVSNSTRKERTLETRLSFLAFISTNVNTNVTFTQMTSRHRKKLYQKPTVFLDKANCEHHLANIILFCHNNTMIRLVFTLFYNSCYQCCVSQ